MKNLVNAVGALIKSKGRYHTEKNYAELLKAYDAATWAAQRPLSDQVLARITDVLKHHNALDGVLRADLAAILTKIQPTADISQGFDGAACMPDECEGGAWIIKLYYRTEAEAACAFNVLTDSIADSEAGERDG